MRSERNDDGSQNPDQVRYLRRRLIGLLTVKLILFTVIFFAAVVIFDRFFASDIGNWIADNTSTWNVYQPGPDQEGSFLREVIESDEYAIWDIQTNPVDGTIWVRDKRVYQLFHDLWQPMALVLYVMDCIMIVGFTLRRALAYFDELESAVEELVRNKEHPVRLSPDLAITEANLNNIRENTLAAEWARVAAETRKDELIAYLAHDIRTPLTSIIGYLHLLKEGEKLDETTQARYLEVVSVKAESLDELINELFEIARFNISEISLECTEVDLHLLCLQVAEELYPQAKEHEIAICVCDAELAEGTEEVRTFIDGPKIARALSNIVRNAIAYGNESSTIEIACGRLADEPRTSETEVSAYITVTNHGPAIALENQERIFDRFFREDAARSTRKGGAGLGLSPSHEKSSRPMAARFPLQAPMEQRCLPLSCRK